MCLSRKSYYHFEDKGKGKGIKCYCRLVFSYDFTPDFTCIFLYNLHSIGWITPPCCDCRCNQTCTTVLLITSIYQVPISPLGDMSTNVYLCSPQGLNWYVYITDLVLYQLSYQGVIMVYYHYNNGNTDSLHPSDMTTIRFICPIDSHTLSLRCTSMQMYRQHKPSII